ncbi:MAG: cytochrome C [Cognaticolwellia sp.]
MKYFILLILLTLFSCNKGVESPRGFSLPKGNADSGKLVFLKYKCLACHTLQGIDDTRIKKHPDISVPLGGEKTQVVTYAQLVTSIINPSHKLANPYSPMSKNPDGTSKMKIFNDEMTVTELINLVSFLQPNYTLAPYQPTNYQYYPN